MVARRAGGADAPGRRAVPEGALRLGVAVAQAGRGGFDGEPAHGGGAPSAHVVEFP